MPPEPRSVLVVAHRTAATPALIEQVRQRAAAGPCTVTLLVPRPLWDAETEEAATAIPLLGEAAGGRVEGLLGEADPFHAVRRRAARRHPAPSSATATSASGRRVGAGRGAGVTAGPFPRPALRTGRAHS